MPTAEHMRRRLWDELDELKSLDDSIKATREQEAQAMAVVEAARRRLSELQQRRNAVVKDTSSIMRVLNTLATFPFELLSLIFTYANTESEDKIFSATAEIDEPRCALPFRLNLVCRRWHEVIRSTPAVWGYMGVSFDAGATAGFKRGRYVQNILSQSGSSPLDVVICYQFSDQSPENGDSRVPIEEGHFERILYLLQINMARIRSLRMSASAPKFTLEGRLPEVARVRNKVLDLLRTPSPSLVNLNIEFPYTFAPGVDPGHDAIAAYWHGGPGETTPLFLPVAPNLRSMHVAFVPVVCRRAHPGLPSLERISIEEGPIYEAHVIDLLAAAPNVQELTLDVGQAQQTPHLPLARTTLPRLSKLEFGDFYSFGLLSNGAEFLPSLSELQLCDLDDLSVSETLVRNLTRLRLFCQENLDDYVDALRPLSNITRAEFWQSSMQDDVFFAPFLDADAPMWPRLEALKLHHTVTRSRDRDGLLRLVQARNGARGANAAVRPLKNVDYDHVSVPSWIDVQIRAILEEVWEDES